MMKNCENVKMCEGFAKKISKIGIGLAVIYTGYKVAILIYQHIGEFKCPFKKKAAESCPEYQADACSEAEKNVKEERIQ